MDRLCGLANDVGLLSEEYDVAQARMAGNFPQAFSHLTLVQAALSLGEVTHRGPAVADDDRAPVTAHLVRSVSCDAPAR